MKAIWSWEAGLRIFKVALVRKLAENLRNFSDGDFLMKGILESNTLVRIIVKGIVKVTVLTVSPKSRSSERIILILEALVSKRTVRNAAEMPCFLRFTVTSLVHC